MEGGVGDFTRAVGLLKALLNTFISEPFICVFADTLLFFCDIFLYFYST